VLFLPLLAVIVQSLTGAPIDALQAPTGTKAIVFLFTSTDCPISNRYAPDVRRLAEEFGPKGVVFRVVYPNPADDAAANVMEPLRDPKQALVTFAGATITPEAAVYAGGRIVYRGRIDDRYVSLGLERPAPTKRDLEEALRAVLAGAKVPHPKTQAVGCFIADFAR
jgi:thiol-disulfide isomerase/thioredoxin